MRPLTIATLAAVIAASGAIAQDNDAYNLEAAAGDLAVFHRHARDGVVRREDVQSDLGFGPRFDEADTDRDRLLTAAEMDRYIERTYGVHSVSAGAGNYSDKYLLHAATRDLEGFLQLARGGALTREEAQAHPVLGRRFDDADADRDGMVSAQEMERYVQRTYGIVSNLAAARSASAAAGSGRKPASPSAGAGAAGNSGSASAGGGAR